MSVPYILTTSSLTVLNDLGEPFTMDRDNKHFQALLDACVKGDKAGVTSIIDIATKINTSVFATKGVQVKDGVVYYNGQPSSNYTASRILEFVALNLDPTPMVNFLDKLMQNPSYKSRESLGRFLDACKHPIDQDGDFYAYKWVRDNYLDVHSGTILNTPGTTVTMDRSQVDDDSNVTCSSGLHVCSNQYTRFGERLLLVKVNPADVVSVPYDYNNAKMRVCKYYIVKEIPQNDFNYIKTDQAVANLTEEEDDSWEDNSWDDESC